MSEKYPRAWVLIVDNKAVAVHRHRKEAMDEAVYRGDCTVDEMELIPLPEHESIVAAAVAAAVERCAGIADHWGETGVARAIRGDT